MHTLTETYIRTISVMPGHAIYGGVNVFRLTHIYICQFCSLHVHTHTHTHGLSLKIGVSGNVNQMNAQQVELAWSIGEYIMCEKSI